MPPSALGTRAAARRVTGSWGCAVRRRLIAQCRNSSDLLLPRPIESFGIAPEDRPDAIVRCSPPGSGYSPSRLHHTGVHHRVETAFKISGIRTVRVVGRLPDITGADDPSYLVDLLSTAAGYTAVKRGV